MLPVFRAEVLPASCSLLVRASFLASTPFPGLKRTPGRLQELPKGAGTRPGGRLHDPHRGFLDPPRNPEMGRMRILSAGRRDLEPPAREMAASVVNSSKVGGSLHTKQAKTPRPV